MTERSRPWDGTTVGDATDAPYDAATEFARILRALAVGAEASVHKSGVLTQISGFGGYNPSVPGGGIVRVASGIGFVWGTWCESDANVDIAIPTPASATRFDRIVLRKSWAAQTIRLTRIAGVEGAPPSPALVQTQGVTWDCPIASVQVTTAGVITVTDERPFMYVPTHSHTATDLGGILSHLSLSNIGVNTHAAIDAALGADQAHRLATTGIHGIVNTLAGTTDNQTIANKDHLNSTYHGREIVTGGGAAPGDPHIESGSVTFGAIASGATPTQTVTFARAFASAPKIVVSQRAQGTDVWQSFGPVVSMPAPTTTQFTIGVKNVDPGTQNITVDWIAFGT